MSKSWTWWLVLAVVATAAVLNGARLAKLQGERDALRATVSALREGDGSCALRNDGPKVVCWMEGGTVKVLTLQPGDVIAHRADVRRKHRRAQ